MGQTLLAAIASGLALAGVLAVAGTAAARLGRGMPHLGVGAAGAAAAVAAGRVTEAPLVVGVLAVVMAGAATGVLAWLVEDHVRRVPQVVAAPALLPAIAVVGLAVGLAGLLRPALAIDLPLGPLGGLASQAGGIVAAVVGLGAAVVLGLPRLARLPEVAVWALSVAAVAVAVAFGSGGLPVGQSPVPAFSLPDVLGLSLRSVAVGVVARLGPGPAVAAALILGVGEAVLRTSLAVGELALLPALAVLTWGALRHHPRETTTVAAE